MIFFAFLVFLFSSDLNASQKSVYELIENNQDLSIFKKYIDNTGLDDVLKKKIPYDWTVYAPSNTAFNNIPNKLKDTILNDSFYSKKLFTDHIMSKQIVSSQLSDKVTTELTVSNKPIQLYKIENLHIKDIVVVKKDLIANNGVVHIIDCLMFIQPSEQDNRLTSEQKKEFPITSCCMQTDDEVKLWMLNTKKIKY
ncbi:MAG: hypothetical protein CMP37_03010 [Rickettsiales bacterium]|nr:hypothetical protein [Rickettsiales bacterium]OUW71085.1 MAG: hypothetical protein CBD71_03030 [Rickettsiales bacterium TMED211]